MSKKRRFWEEPGWECISRARKHPWSLGDPSDWQDVLSTEECVLEALDELFNEESGASTRNGSASSRKANVPSP
jgi:hypothetical protein